MLASLGNNGLRYVQRVKADSHGTGLDLLQAQLIGEELPKNVGDFLKPDAENTDVKGRKKNSR